MAKTATTTAMNAQTVYADGGAIRSPWKMAWRKLRRHKLAMIAMWVLIVLHLLRFLQISLPLIVN